MTALLLTAFILGLTGSLHCLAMCGPLNMVFQQGLRPGRNAVKGISTYHTGRLTVYAAFGAIGGQLGYILDLAGWQTGLSLTTGIALIAICLVEIFRPGWLAKLASPFLTRLGHSAARSAFKGWFVAGALNGLLPCGLVIAALAAAVQSGTWYTGATIMLTFGLGTIPLLVGTTHTATRFGLNKLRTLNRYIIPLLMLTTGIFLITRALPTNIPCCPPEAEHLSHQSD